jgi:hypothetical protein
MWGYEVSSPIVPLMNDPFCVSTIDTVTVPSVLELVKDVVSATSIFTSPLLCVKVTVQIYDRPLLSIKEVRTTSRSSI